MFAGLWLPSAGVTTEQSTSCSVMCHVSRVTPAPLLSNLLIRHRHSALCTAVQPHFYTVQCPRVTKQHFYAGHCPSVTKHLSAENVHFKPPSVTANPHTCDKDSGDRRYITRETMSTSTTTIFHSNHSPLHFFKEM